MHEGIPILNYLVPKTFEHRDGKLVGMTFEKVRAEKDAKGRRQLVPTGEPDAFFECDEVLIAVGQENAFPWIERDCGIEFGEWDMPVVDKVTMRSSHPKVFFGGDAAFGPKNIIWAVAQSDAGSVRGRRIEDGPRDGQGRGRVPALRTVRRALSDRRLGHAEVLPRTRAGVRSPPPRTASRASAPAARGGSRMSLVTSKERGE